MGDQSDIKPINHESITNFVTEISHRCLLGLTRRDIYPTMIDTVIGMTVTIRKWVAFGMVAGHSGNGLERREGGDEQECKD